MTGKTHAACGAATMLALTVLHRSGLPIGAVNATVGTGSECTSFYIVTDPVRHSKMAMVDPADFGTLADLALHDTCMITNQLTPTRQEVIAVYTAAFRG